MSCCLCRLRNVVELVRQGLQNAYRTGGLRMGQILHQQTAAANSVPTALALALPLMKLLFTVDKKLAVFGLRRTQANVSACRRIASACPFPCCVASACRDLGVTRRSDLGAVRPRSGYICSCRRF